MSDRIVEAAGLVKTYPVDGTVQTALGEASFLISAGDRVALTGPSGSGKTTLLHLIAGLDVPTRGTIQWPALGGDPRRRPGSVTIAFQGPSLLPALSVAENVALPLLFAGMTESDAAERANAILVGMALDELADALPEELSGGQSQRVGIARALVSRPALVLADEPTGQQDRDHAEALMDTLVNQVEQSGAALIVATHDPRVAERFATRWTMRDGTLTTGSG
jgi:ABC-type lipoprotein export system ATPase subunit